MFSRRILRTPVRALRVPHTTRHYATEKPPDKSAEMPRMGAAAVVTAGAAYFYYLQYGSGSNSRHGSEQQATSADKESAGSLGQPPSTVDSAGTRKEAGGAGTMSGKQEGWSNATTDNPFINAPGKSVKGEGETETAKVKGTVSPQRPQA